ncbi:hypothetical protein ACB092_08G040100 [Castanea dentata]
MLGMHQGRVQKLALEQGGPHILYSCGEDSFFDLRSRSATKLFCCSSLTENSKRPPKNIRLNAIVIDPGNPDYIAVGGSDEYACVYDLRKCQLNASTLSYSNTSEHLVSYNDELIYLFQKYMGLGHPSSSAPTEDLLKNEEPQAYLGHGNSKTVKSSDGSDCGHIFIWKKKGAELVHLMVGDRHVVNHLAPHPHIPILATCGIEKNVKLWAPMASDAPPMPANAEQLLSLASFIHPQITESNRQGREDHARVTLAPDVIMHVLRYSRADIESDEEDGGYGLSDGNSTECNVG